MMKCLNCSVEQGSLIFCLQIGAVWIQVFIPTEILKTPAVGLENCQSWIVRVVFKKLASPCPEELCIYSFFFSSFLIKTACLHFCLASKWSHVVIQPCLFVMCPFSLVFYPPFPGEQPEDKLFVILQRSRRMSRVQQRLLQPSLFIRSLMPSLQSRSIRLIKREEDWRGSAVGSVRWAWNRVWTIGSRYSGRVFWGGICLSGRHIYLRFCVILKVS